MRTVKQRLTEIEKLYRLDSDGRDPDLVEMMEFVAGKAGLQFRRDSVPVGFSLRSLLAAIGGDTTVKLPPEFSGLKVHRRGLLPVLEPAPAKSAQGERDRPNPQGN